MATLPPNAIHAARPIGYIAPRSAPSTLPAAVMSIAPPITSAALRGGGSAAASARPAPIPATDAARRGRPTKDDRMREARRAASDKIRAFADTKPSKRAVREFFVQRISELNDEKGV